LFFGWDFTDLTGNRYKFAQKLITKLKGINGEISDELASLGIKPRSTSKFSKVHSVIEKLIRKKVFFFCLDKSDTNTDLKKEIITEYDKWMKNPGICRAS
jgi:hypothetical protein